MNLKEEQTAKEKTMKISVKEGSFASVMTGFGDTYVVPYALAINSNNLQIGLLRSFSSLLPPLTQLYGSKLMEKYSRKSIIMKYVSLQALMFLPILALSLLFWKNFLGSYLPYILIAFYTLYAIFGSIAGPAWFSLMGDIVPESIRGKYFGKRNRIAESVVLISSLAGAFLLDYLKTKGWLLIGFSILFLFASLARFASAYSFKWHYNPKFRQEKKYHFSFLDFVKGIKRRNFARFSLFIACMNLAAGIVGPFFSVYMLKNLGFSYTTFMIVSLSQSFSTILTMPLWGKFSDKYGRKTTLVLSGIFVSIMPIMWLFSSSPYYLAIPMIIVGIGWAGFNLASFNFIYDCVTPQRRALCTAYYNILIGAGVFIGSALGGILLEKLPSFTLWNPFFVIFTLSSVTRLLSVIIFTPLVKEVRKVRKFHPTIIFRKMLTIPGINEIYMLEEIITSKTKKLFRI